MTRRSVRRCSMLCYAPLRSDVRSGIDGGLHAAFASARATRRRVF